MNALTCPQWLPMKQIAMHDVIIWCLIDTTLPCVNVATKHFTIATHNALISSHVNTWTSISMSQACTQMDTQMDRGHSRVQAFCQCMSQHAIFHTVIFSMDLWCVTAASLFKATIDYIVNVILFHGSIAGRWMEKYYSKYKMYTLNQLFVTGIIGVTIGQGDNLYATVGLMTRLQTMSPKYTDMYTWLKPHS